MQNRRLPMPRLLAGLSALLALIGLTILALVLVRQNQMQTLAGLRSELSAGATLLNPPREVIPFTLDGSNNQPVSLDDLRGRYTLMSFGYTHCPDVCPLNLSEFQRIKRDLTAEEAAQVNFVFVSVDGERDTPELLARYLMRFDEAFLGLSTPDDSVLRPIAESFSVHYERREVANTAAPYLMDHTATTFLLNPRGELLVLYPFGTAPSDISQDLRVLFEI